MKEDIIRVSLSFAKGNALQIVGTSNTIQAKLYQVPELNLPPITAAELAISTSDLTVAQADMVNGGKLATAERDRLQEILLGQLKELAYFVQLKCKNSLSVVLASGFEAVSSNRASTPLRTPSIVSITNGQAEYNVIAVDGKQNVRSWETQFALVDPDGAFGPWTNAQPATSSRRILVGPLQPGSMYAHRVRGVGGSTGCSDWSNFVTHRAS